MLALSPRVDRAILGAQQTRVASTSQATNVANRNVLYKNGRVFESDRIVYAKLAVFISSHRVDVVIAGDEASVTCAASNEADRDVVRAKFGERVLLVARQIDSKT